MYGVWQVTWNLFKPNHPVLAKKDLATELEHNQSMLWQRNVTITIQISIISKCRSLYLSLFVDSKIIWNPLIN
jgi:hypothetical protein